MRLRIFKLLCAIVAGLLLVAVTLPWWLGAALGWVGPRWLGLEFRDYQRLGYGRFALSEAVVRRPEVVVRVARIEADTPLLWLWSHAVGGTFGEVLVGAWSVDVPKGAAEERDSATSSESGWVVVEQNAEQVVDALVDWLPAARAEAGSVSFDGGKIEVGLAQWADGRLQVSRVAWDDRVAMGVVVTRDDDGLRMTAGDPEGRWAIDGRARGPTLAVGGTFWQQAWSLSAEFDPTGWRPLRATLQASNWTLPGELVGGGQLYAELTGEARATWADNRLAFSIDAVGKPVDEAPPLQVALVGGGDEQELRLERLTVEAPGVSASLDQPVRLTAQGRLLSEESKFTLSADLAKWQGLSARGKVEGSLTVQPGEGEWPKVSGVLSASGMETHGWTVNGIKAKATLQWPELMVSTAQIKLPGGEGLEVSGKWNLTEQTLADGKVSGKLTPVTLGPWVPAGVVFKAVELTGTAEGHWPDLMHAGTLQVSELRTDWLRPVNAEATWSGRGQAADTLSLAVKTDGAALQLAGSVNRSGGMVQRLSLEQADQVQWTLNKPAAVSWQPELRVDGVLLEGAAGRLRIDGGERHLELYADGVGLDWLKPWLVEAGPDWMVDTLAVKGAWPDGVLTGTVSGQARLPLPGKREAIVEVQASADKDGVRVQTMQVSSGGQQVVSASGVLPVVIYPLAADKLVALPDGKLAISARTEPQAKFWTWLAELSGVVVVDPQLDVAVSGSWRKPTGRAELTVTRIAADKARWPQALPEVEGLRAELTGDSGGVLLKELVLRVAGQELTAEGRLPVAPLEWGGLLAEPSRLATAGGTLRIRIPDADMAGLARFLPEYLAPAGRLQLDMALQADGGWTGFVRLQGAASRPLGPLGVLGDVNADMELAGHAVMLTEVSAFVGGQSVRLTGSVDFKDWRNPAPDLRLKGENLPLVRQSGVLVRADLDLRAHTNAAGVVGVSGVTSLHDSLLLADLRSLLPKGGRSGPMRRPPYFSVEAPPLNRWTLDVSLRGERFLKLRTPLFNGLVSARFRLGGTLGEPRLLGEAPIDEGTVRLPFASFVVEQGMIRISETNPEEPQISLAATARRYGYDLRMELSGTASAPELTFSSSPPLTSEQVLLMVMAGETPENEVSYTAGQRAVRVGTYLGQSLLGTFGLDPSETDRLTVTVGEQISRQGRETYDVSYKLSDRWTLTGEYNEFDDYNVGMKWRFYTSKPEQKKEADEQP